MHGQMHVIAIALQMHNIQVTRTSQQLNLYVPMRTSQVYAVSMHVIYPR